MSKSLIQIYIIKKNSINMTIKTINNKYKEYEIYKSMEISCYEISIEYIVCFYKNKNNYYTMWVFNSSLYFIDNFIVADNNKLKFFKFIYSFEEIWAFAYFSNDNIVNKVFKKYCGETSQISKYLQKITLNNYQFSYNLTLNDIMKVSD